MAMTAPTDAPCPVCRAQTGRQCIGVDYLPLPGVHGERTAETPIYADVRAQVAVELREAGLG